ncbi:MAG: hypothetical protein Q7R70_06590 [Candidatus Diapherotrites archaeon]|nr:hypothetical protein [Candidatus Diapherotrites archaeon]
MLEPIILGFFEEMYFVIQVFIMISIISFILNHLGKGLLSIILIIVMFYVVFILIPAISIGAFMIYTLLMAGVSTLFVDFFFITAGQPGQQQQQGEERPDVLGTDVKERQKQLQHAHHASHQAIGMLQGLLKRGR